MVGVAVEVWSRCGYLLKISVVFPSFVDLPSVLGQKKSKCNESTPAQNRFRPSFLPEKAKLAR